MDQIVWCLQDAYLVQGRTQDYLIGVCVWLGGGGGQNFWGVSNWSS